MGIQIGARNQSVGDIRESVLTEAEFQSLNGTGWVLMDGRNIAGSALATVKGWSTVPDARGQFLRGKNNGRADGLEDPSGERALGNRQGHAFQTHTHAQNAHTHTDAGHIHGTPNNIGFTSDTFNSYALSRSIVDNALSTETGYANIQNTTATNQNQSATGVASEPTTAETRPANISINYFIKIN